MLEDCDFGAVKTYSIAIDGVILHLLRNSLYGSPEVVKEGNYTLGIVDVIVEF